MMIIEAMKRKSGVYRKGIELELWLVETNSL